MPIWQFETFLILDFFLFFHNDIMLIEAVHLGMLLIVSLNNAMQVKSQFSDKNEEATNSRKATDDTMHLPHIEIRAVMLKCLKYDDFEGLKSSRSKTTNNLPYMAFDRDESVSNSEVTKCDKKLIFTIKINKEGKSDNKNEFIVVDHVYDMTTKQRGRLLSPYVFKIRHQQLTQLYELKLLNIVNAEAYEEVLNKQCPHYRGCDDFSENPTCGIIRYQGKIIPYSRGFCCSCDALKNSQRQPSTPMKIVHANIGLSNLWHPPKKSGQSTENITNEKINYFGYLNMPSKFEVDLATTTDTTTESSSTSNYPNVSMSTSGPTTSTSSDLNTNELNRRSYELLESFLDDFGSANLTDSLLPKLRKRKQIFSSGLQTRGGQDCTDRSTPAGVDPTRYQESTHCLRFSDLWYTVYALSEPIVEHKMIIQLFVKEAQGNGKMRWREITKGHFVKLGTLTSRYKDSTPTFSFSYNSLTKCTQGPFNLNPSVTRLLIPEPVSPDLAHLYPQLKGGADEYLIVSPDQITPDGEECDKLGVSYKAFVTQPNRCNKPPGTCLNNQPAHLWYRDKKADLEGKPGSHFLKFFGQVPSEPIQITPNNKKYLALEYEGKLSSVIDVELRADQNQIVRSGVKAQISEVDVDSTCQSETKIYVKITNNGLVSSSFGPRLTDCPLTVPTEWNHIEAPLKVIAPNHQMCFVLRLKGAMPLDRFHCSIEVINEHRQLVAIRRIRVQHWDRCVCLFYCLCACLGSTNGLACNPMSKAHFNAAGFPGRAPSVQFASSFAEHHTTMFMILASFGWIFLILILLGLIKALLGLLIKPVGICGIDWMARHPYEISQYREQYLMKRKVIYDSTGWPIHPDTQRKSVRVVPLYIEFILNIFFFILLPFVLLLRLCLKCTSCCCCQQCENKTSQPEKKPSKWMSSVYFVSETRKDGETEKLLLPENNCSTSSSKSTTNKSSKTSKSSKSLYTDDGEEEEDTKYVLNEYKKSKKALEK